MPARDPKIYAQVRLDRGNRFWAAEVTKCDEGWQVTYRNPSGGTPGGIFTDKLAMRRSIERTANTVETSSGATWVVAINTLDNLRDLPPESVVPKCFVKGVLNTGGLELGRCLRCPYKSECGEPAHGGQPDFVGTKKKGNTQGWQGRLRRKMFKKYGTIFPSK